MSVTQHCDPAVQAFLYALEQRLDRIEAALSELQQRCECQRTKEFYSVNEVAARLRKANWTVRNWARTGAIKAHRSTSGYGVGGSWRISHDELMRLEGGGPLNPSSHRERSY